MADLEGNIEALRRTLGAAFVLHEDPKTDPQVLANRLPSEPLRVVTIATAGYTSVGEVQEEGFELHLLHTSTLGAACVVRFKDNGADYPLRPGECVRVPRGFRRFYMQSTGEAGSLVFGIARHPAVVLEPSQAIWTPKAIGVQGVVAESWAQGSVVNAPAAGAVLADTGALPAGDYELRIIGAGANGSTVVADVQHRNAANAATLFSQYVGSNNNTLLPERLWFRRYTLALDERIRVLNVTAGAPAGDSQWSIFYRRVF